MTHGDHPTPGQISLRRDSTVARADRRTGGAQWNRQDRVPPQRPAAIDRRRSLRTCRLDCGEMADTRFRVAASSISCRDLTTSGQYTPKRATDSRPPRDGTNGRIPTEPSPPPSQAVVTHRRRQVCSQTHRSSSFRPGRSAVHCLRPSGAGKTPANSCPTLHRPRRHPVAKRGSRTYRHFQCWLVGLARTRTVASVFRSHPP